MSSPRCWRLLAAALSLTLVAAACGDDDDGDDTSSATTTVDDAVDDTGGGDTGDPADDPADDTGDDTGDEPAATAADDSLEPVKIGLMNQENSPIGSFPEYRESVEAAAEYANDNLGGIDGHPIEIVSCVQASTEEAQACAQELASEGVVSVFGGINISTIGFDFYGTLGATPVIGGTPLFPADYEAATARFFYGGVLTVFGAMAQFVSEELEATNVAILQNDNPGGQASAQAAADTFDSLGVAYTRINIPSPATDVTPQVTQAAGGGFDAVLVLVSAAECGQVIASADQLGIDPATVVYTGTCNDANIIEEFGDLAAGSYFHTTLITARSSGEAATDEKVAEAEEIGLIQSEYNPEGTTGAFATLGVQDLLIVQEIYSSIGFDALSDPANILAALDENEWDVPAGTSLRCGTWSLFPSVCNGDNYFPVLTDGGETVGLDRPYNVLDLIGN